MCVDGLLLTVGVYDFDTTVLLKFFMQMGTGCFAMTPGQKSELQ